MCDLNANSIRWHQEVPGFGFIEVTCEVQGLPSQAGATVGLKKLSLLMVSTHAQQQSRSITKINSVINGYVNVDT